MLNSRMTSHSRLWNRRNGWASLLIATALAAVIGAWLLRPLASPFETGTLVVLTRQSPTTYYFDAEGRPAGFEHDLAIDFAARQGLAVEFEVAEDLSDLVDGIASGRAHVAAAGLAVTPGRAGRVRFGPVYAREQEWIICAAGPTAPASLADLVGLRLEVIKDSSHAERLLELRLVHPRLAWIEQADASSEDLLERVATGLADCTVADGGTFDVVRHYWPNLVKAVRLSERRDIAWGMPLRADPRLRQALADYFRDIQASGRLGQLKERYFGHLQRLGEADVQGILTRRTRLLPEFKTHFLEAQEETGLDWRLLAALAYQESQWNPLATSPTGVRGMMMLTSETADRLGVSNRLDARESILGGARYLVMLRDTLPDRIPEPDRTWMAMAAYNIGQGHFEDARRLAQRLGKNPDAWRDVKQVLPLLAKSSHASSLRFGYARGGEATILAENVRIYYDILKRFESAPES